MCIRDSAYIRAIEDRTFGSDTRDRGGPKSLWSTTNEKQTPAAPRKERSWASSTRPTTSSNGSRVRSRNWPAGPPATRAGRRKVGDGQDDAQPDGTASGVEG